MAINISNAAAKVVNLAGGIVAEGYDVAGGYFVIDNILKIPSYTNTTGQLCYCTGDNKFYQYNGTAWVEKEFGTTGGGNTDVAEKANQIQVNFVDEGVTTTEYAKITASSDEPTGGEKGDIWFKY